MKKILCLGILSLVLSGCGKIDREIAKMTGSGAKTCVEGVMYLQFTSGTTVMYNKDGTIKLCQ